MSARSMKFSHSFTVAKDSRQRPPALPPDAAGGSIFATMKARSEEGLKPGDCAAEDKGMHVMSAFVGVDGLEVDHVAHHLEILLDAVAAMHVARGPGDVQRLAAVVALDETDHFGRRLRLVHEPADAQ